MGNFEGFDVAGFWDDSAYALKDYVEETPPSRELIEALEDELGGYRLPDSYVALMTAHNGGIPARTCFPMAEPTSWADDYIEITGIRGIGHARPQSLGGEFGSLFWIDMWEYPDIGVYFADTPSAGHDMLALDYRACGPDGEPTVVHVDQENDFAITLVAENFEAFVTGLVDESVYDTSEQDRLAELAMVRDGSFSPVLLRAFGEVADVLPDADRRMRALAAAVVHDKGFFALHADARSMLMYDYLFWLFTSFNRVDSFEGYLKTPPQAEGSGTLPTYELMITGCGPAHEPYGFRTGGYGPARLEEWWNSRIASGHLTETVDGYRFTDAAVAALLDELAAVAGDAIGRPLG
ncbi:SMI1/KNR4 family protein [Kitasatospora sp. NPDC059408]|uniref:SMI1/KNR4 family protein n=1 Tax=Kitasatospora sp. NPDC059408 TaxID=3346823 RepID=UPI003691D511